MVLTSSQLAEYLEEISYPVPIRVMDSPQPERLRKFPSVEVDNITPRDDTEDYQINKTQQRFVIHIYMRIKAGATEETSLLQTIEDLIRVKIDGVQLAGSKIILQTATWNRLPVQGKVYHYDSNLTVSAVDQSAVTGILGLQQTLTIGALTLQLFGETGEKGRRYTDRIDDAGARKINKGPNIGNKFFEFAYTKSIYDTIDALILADNEITVTLTENGTPTAIIGKPVYQRTSTRYDNQKVIILEFQY